MAACPAAWVEKNNSVSLEQIGGMWCPAGDPHFGPVLEQGLADEFDGEVFAGAIAWLGDRRVALDIGAHIGLWTTRLARHFAQVVAFEPDAENFAALVENTAGMANVRPLPLAMAPRSGRFALSHEGTMNSGEGYLVPLNGHDDWVVGLALDDARFVNVDLIKLDIEGLEAEALPAAERTVRECRPVIVLEENRTGVRYGGQVGDARRLLQSWGMIEVDRYQSGLHDHFDVLMAWEPRN